MVDLPSLDVELLPSCLRERESGSLIDVGFLEIERQSMLFKKKATIVCPFHHG